MAKPAHDHPWGYSAHVVRSRQNGPLDVWVEARKEPGVDVWVEIRNYDPLDAPVWLNPASRPVPPPKPPRIRRSKLMPPPRLMPLPPRLLRATKREKTLAEEWEGWDEWLEENYPDE